MFGVYEAAISYACALAEAQAEVEWGRKFKNAPIEVQSAMLAARREREAHRKALEVARASAPVTNVTVRNYW